MFFVYIMSQKNPNTQYPLTKEERKKAIEEICKAECANCENWDKQKQCIACDIFKTLSDLEKH